MLSNIKIILRKKSFNLLKNIYLPVDSLYSLKLWSIGGRLTLSLSAVISAESLSFSDLSVFASDLTVADLFVATSSELTVSVSLPSWGLGLPVGDTLSWGLGLSVGETLSWGLGLPVGDTLSWGLGLPFVDTLSWGLGLPVGDTFSLSLVSSVAESSSSPLWTMKQLWTFAF